MDSEDEMQDALCGTSDGDDFYGDEDGQDYESDDLPLDYENVDDDYAADDIIVDDSSVHRRNELPFTILSEKDIQIRQEEAIASVEAVLSIPRTHAIILLWNMDWSVNRVNEEWFADEVNVRKRVGLLLKPEKSESMQNGIRRDIREIKCGICLEYHPTERMQTAYCNHYYCLSCWKGYVCTSIHDGPGCLSLRCPNPDCNAAVGEELIISLSSEVESKKYRQYILRSYVEANRKVKWCPAPGCEYAVECTSQNNIKDVICGCGSSFCWNCCEEAHRPVECATVALWILKNSAESENMNWILANSKPCPKCKRPIEKNQGCMHITCTPPCKFEFCWLCLGSWAEHGERTGGFYACNRYESERKEGKHDESEKRREMAKNSLERYTHYYERWASNEQSRSKAISDLQQMQDSQMEQLSDKQSFPVSQLNFITEAWLQIVECRRVLKWTYAYGYYLSEEDIAKKQFFEYLQGEAEAGLERLHKCAEKDIKIHLEVADEASFNEFRIKLADLTSVTRNYFQNLVQALENGLADVDSSAAPNTKRQSWEMGRSSMGILDWQH